MMQVPPQRTRMSTEPPEPITPDANQHPQSASIPSASAPPQSTLDSFLRPLALTQPAMAPLVELLVAQDTQLRVLTEAVEKLVSAQREGNEEMKMWRSMGANPDANAVKQEVSVERTSVSVGVQAGEEESELSDMSIDSDSKDAPSPVSPTSATAVAVTGSAA